MKILNGLLVEVEASVVSLIIGFVVLGVLTILTLVAIIAVSRFHKRWVWTWQGHEIVLSMSRRGLELFVNGKLEDVLAAQNVRQCMLKAFVDGQVVKVALTARAFRWDVEAHVGNETLTLNYSGK